MFFLQLGEVVYIFLHELNMKKVFTDVRLDVFMAMKTEFVVFWVAVPCSLVIGYQPLKYWHPSTNSKVFTNGHFY